MQQTESFTSGLREENMVSIPPLVGEWVFEGESKTYAAPICCGWDHQHWRSNKVCGEPRQSFEMYQGSKDNKAQVGGCTCSTFTDKYTWKSDQLPTLDPYETCRLLGNRTVLMIGDSTMQQTTATLMNALFPVGCQSQIVAGVSDTLIGKPLAGKRNRGLPWLEHVNRTQPSPDIVILTAGAHIYSEYNFTLVLESVVEGTKRLKDFLPSILVPWKTQQPGGYSLDIPTRQDPVKAATVFDWSMTPNRYQHGTFYSRDLQVFRTLPAEGIPVIDMRMLYSRSDAKVGSLKDRNECLHFCVPGPLDVFAASFQKQLQDGI
jgi:hypothetical protein